MNPRTLQRRLEESGTTYQQLLDEVRQGTARKRLAAIISNLVRSPSCSGPKN